MKGFTFVELLVVISIVAILSVIGLVTYAAFLSNTRDAKRQSDLKLIQSALEQYHGDQKYYPYEISPGGSLVSGSKTYLNKVPSDPKGSPNYSYVSSGASCNALTPQNCTSYCLYAKLEGTVPVSDQGCTSAIYNYGVTKP